MNIRRFFTALLTNANSGVFYAETKFLLIFNLPIFNKIENMQRIFVLFLDNCPNHNFKITFFTIQSSCKMMGIFGNDICYDFSLKNLGKCVKNL